MFKFTSNYREFISTLNPFRSKTAPKAARSVSTPANQKGNPSKRASKHPGSVFGQPRPCQDTHEPSIDALALRKKPNTDRMFNRLATYLNKQKNLPEDIAKLHRILGMQHVILEIGCGNCDLAKEIALKNPAWGVIATDKYAWNIPLKDCSHYQKLAVAWKENRVKAQQTMPSNIVTLRAEAEILSFLPDLSLESVLLVNPEPLVGQALLKLISIPALYAKIKPGLRQIVIVPFSREMGVVTCGGYEFDHAQDWSQGLGFIMASGFDFQKADKFQWGVDLRRVITL